MTMSNDALVTVIARTDNEAAMEKLFGDIEQWAASEFIWFEHTKEASCMLI